MYRCRNLKILFSIKIFFALFNAIVSNEATFENVSDEEKRSLFGTVDGSVPPYQLVEVSELSWSNGKAPDVLNITFNDGANQLISILYIVKDHDLINENVTNIVTLKSDGRPEPKLNKKLQSIMCIGDVAFYQNLNDSSAVTRLLKPEGDVTYIGMLEKKYIMKSAPQSFISKKDRNSKYVVIFKYPEVWQKYDPPRQFQNPNLSNLELYRITQRNAKRNHSLDVVYPKLNIMIDYASLIDHEGNIPNLVTELIAHFHVVNLLFRQLRYPDVRLTILEIIIPLDELSVPQISNNTTSSEAILLASVIKKLIISVPQNYCDVFIAMTKNFLYGTNVLETNKLRMLKDRPAGSMLLSGSPCNRVGDPLTADDLPPLGLVVMQYDTGFPGVNTTATFLSRVLRFGFEQASCMRIRPNKLPGLANILKSTGSWKKEECLNPLGDVPFSWAPSGPNCILYQLHACSGQNVCDRKILSPTYGTCISVDRLRTEYPVNERNITINNIMNVGQVENLRKFPLGTLNTSAILYKREMLST